MPNPYKVSFLPPDQQGPMSPEELEAMKLEMAKQQASEIQPKLSDAMPAMTKEETIKSIATPAKRENKAQNIIDYLLDQGFNDMQQPTPQPPKLTSPMDVLRAPKEGYIGPDASKPQNNILSAITNTGGKLWDFAQTPMGLAALGATQNDPDVKSALFGKAFDAIGDQNEKVKNWQDLENKRKDRQSDLLKTVLSGEYGLDKSTNSASGHQNFEPITYTDEKGLIRRGVFNKVKGEYETSEGALIAPTRVQMYTDPITGNKVTYLPTAVGNYANNSTGKPLGSSTNNTTTTSIPSTVKSVPVQTKAVNNVVSTPKTVVSKPAAIRSYQWTPEQRKGLGESEKIFRHDPRFAKTVENISRINSAKAKLNNPAAAQSLKVDLLKLSGDTGNAGQMEQEGYGGSKAVKDRIEQAFSTAKTGQLSPDNKKYILDLINVFDKTGQQSKQNLINETTSLYLQKYPDAPQENVAKYFDTFISPQNQSSGKNNDPLGIRSIKK